MTTFSSLEELEIGGPNLNGTNERVTRILDESAKAMEGTAIPSDLVGPFGEIDLLNTLYAYLARYHNATGNNDTAIATANKVDLGATSYFSYDAENANPIFGGFFVGTVEYAPRTHFGLPDALAPGPADGRIGFYLNIVGNTSLYRGLPLEEMAAPFFSSQTASIPAYLPGEMLLIKAEAYARKGEIGNAEAALNMVRQKTADNDIYGLGAGLTDTYSSGGNQAALLSEIYRNRRAELFLIGTSLDDSRRFNRPEPPTTTDFASERNRNFYPCPDNERESNPNTPNDPPI